ncbi:hypothetical protein FS749_011259 [Ceratobasidium sp. UAMH 11750]|nr:hypothetical protein FS749_011259 [Ceratobasidium sp. UAMH 11750]
MPEKPIQCPYVIGAKFRLRISPPIGPTYEAQVTVIDIYTPFTMSSVMKVSLDPVTLSQASSCANHPFDLPSEMILKVYDRRFAYSFRKHHCAKPATYESEASYYRYAASGRAPEGVSAIDAELNTYFYRKLDDPPELVEHLLATKIGSLFDSECTIYKHLSDLQGRYIPLFYGTTQFISGLSVPDLDSPVRGVLLEVIPGINLDTIQPQSVDLGALITGAMHIVDLCGDMGVLNKDVRLGNFIVKPDGSVVMIDFAHARLRDPEEDDLAWRHAKWGEDEEGCIGYIAQRWYNWPYIPTRKYAVKAEDDN